MDDATITAQDLLNNIIGRDEALMTPGEVASLFRVDPKTVTRWAKNGKIPSVRTLGGHRRYKMTDVIELLKSRHEPKKQ